MNARFLQMRELNKRRDSRTGKQGSDDSIKQYTSDVLFFPVSARSCYEWSWKLD